MRIIIEINNIGKVLDVTIDKNINWENFIKLVEQLLDIEKQLKGETL
jgi:hypothetical protein